jgi:hypothetical protein
MLLAGLDCIVLGDVSSLCPPFLEFPAKLPGSGLFGLRSYRLRRFLLGCVVLAGVSVGSLVDCIVLGDVSVAGIVALFC